MRRLPRPQLCLVTDPAMPDLPERVEVALAAGVTMLQVRGPQLSANRLYELALLLRPFCRRYGAAFIVNDRLDVGLAVGADGFQLGSRSLSLSVARKLVGDDRLLGASIHSLAEAQSAAADGADFLIAGTIFASPSHPGGPTSGPDLLRAIKRVLPTCPLLAIGGIQLSNAGQVMAAEADGVAVISAILSAADIASAVKQMREIIDRPGQHSPEPSFPITKEETI